MDRKFQPDYQAMADLRYCIRCFLRFSEKAAREAGVEAQQQQLLLALKGLPDGAKPTIGVLAERLQLQHHSTVGLIDRLVERGRLVRLRAADDKRQVLIKLSQEGEECLRKLAFHHLQELRTVGPKFVKVLQSLLEHAAFSNERGPRTRKQAHSKT
jgi:DNA-binding MarR family transcriptional regulator